MRDLIKHGSTKEDGRRNENSINSVASQKLGYAQDESRNDGINQNRFNQSASRRQANNRRVQQSLDDFGKVLDRLEFIKNEYLLYVTEEQDYLESRLKESKRREVVLKEAIQELEQHVHELLTEQTND